MALHCTAISGFKLNVLTVFWKTANCFSTLWHCLFVLLILLPLKPTLHLARWLIHASSYISQHQQSLNPPQLSRRVWPTCVIQVYQQPVRSEDPQPGSAPLTGVPTWHPPRLQPWKVTEEYCVGRLQQNVSEPSLTLHMKVSLLIIRTHQSCIMSSVALETT